MIELNREKIESYDSDKIKTLRENALRLGKQDVANLCDLILLSRKPPKKPKSIKTLESRNGHYVSEFHFVCPNELGVVRNPDGTIWSGTWVVAQKIATASEKYGATVALHSRKAEPSYLQGAIKGWRIKSREKRYSGDQETKIKEGIEFLLEPMDQSLEWNGDSSGERGYYWTPIP